MPLNDFKIFVKQRPNLANYVNKNEMTWQKFYEMYELYGPDNSVWDKYLKTTTATTSFKDMFGMFKNVNMNDLQDGITSLQKGIGYLQDMIKTKAKDVPVRKSSYEPRPMYKHFDD